MEPAALGGSGAFCVLSSVLLLLINGAQGSRDPAWQRGASPAPIPPSSVCLFPCFGHKPAQNPMPSWIFAALTKILLIHRHSSVWDGVFQERQLKNAPIK